MSPPSYMIPLLVLLVLVCYGSALRPLSYRCSQPSGGFSDPACTLMGDVYTCTTNGSVVPYLSDGVRTTQYLWRGSSFLDLDIPNSVCLEAIVITFNKPTSDINLPGLTLEQTTAFNTTYPSSPDGIENTTITFTQQYCQPTIRINMTQAVVAHYTILLEVFLIEPVDSSGTAGGSVTPSSSAGEPSSSQGPATSSPGVTPTPGGGSSLPLVAGLAAGGVVIIVLIIVIVLLGILVWRKRKLRVIYSKAAYNVNGDGSGGGGGNPEDIYTVPDKERTFTSTSMVKPSKVDPAHFTAMEDNTIYDGVGTPEYAEIPQEGSKREGSIRSVNLPSAPPPYHTRSSASPKYKTVEEDSSEFNIYASANDVVKEEGRFDDIYSEPYDLTTYATEDRLVGRDHHIQSMDTTLPICNNLTPYSSIYAMPSLLDRSEGPKEISVGSIEEVKPLGVGQFGEVVLAQTVGLSLKDLRLSDTDTDTSIKVSVAVKKLKEESQSSTREAFEKEIKFMSRLTHVNVVRLLAVCLKGTPFIVMEYMEEGDLNQFLKKRQFSSSRSDYSNTLDLQALVDVSKQIASGMEYLASKKFIHRDLATRNCLMGKNLTVKIADFGMSQNLYSDYYFRLKGRAVLPIRWMACECFYGRFSIKTDVWAFGVTLWEVFTLGQNQPYGDWTDQEVIENAVLPSRGGESVKLAQPDLCPAEVYQLMLKCWLYESSSRPSFSQICASLKKLQKDMM